MEYLFFVAYIMLVFVIFFILEIKSVINRKYNRCFKFKNSTKIKKNIFWCEIKKFYPLRKLFFIGLTSFSYYLLIGIVIKVCDKVKHGFRIFPEDLLSYALVIIISIIISKYTFKYIREWFKCVPVISRSIPISELYKSIHNEDFKAIEEYKGSEIYRKILIGDKWYYINGYFVKKKSLKSVVIGAWRHNPRHSGVPGRELTTYYFIGTYENGENVKIKITTMYNKISSVEERPNLHLLECEVDKFFRKILLNTFSNDLERKIECEDIYILKSEKILKDKGNKLL